MFERASRTVARLLDAHLEVQVADTGSAAKLDVQVVESVPHELVIRHDGTDVDRILHETVRSRCT